jgi:hypothetical protein
MALDQHVAGVGLAPGAVEDPDLVKRTLTGDAYPCLGAS